jgi:hypothetical protein
MPYWKKDDEKLSMPKMVITIEEDSCKISLNEL